MSLKVHVALNTPHFDQSVTFYRAFLGLEPVKLKPGYAKFDVADPPLNLTLNEGPAPTPGALSHLGVQVSTTEAVLAATDRLRAAGLITEEEHGKDCCYALQDKVWVKDPNGNRWEVFVVKVSDTQPTLTVSATKTEKCCSHS
jgi:catechol 2,3-dioxygenase-like lactoylglutathione lyase family enzyme